MYPLRLDSRVRCGALQIEQSVTIPQFQVGSTLDQSGFKESGAKTLSALWFHNDSLPGPRSVMEAIDNLLFGRSSSSEKKNRSTAKMLTTPKM